jgi:hypothetical protein
MRGANSIDGANSTQTSRQAPAESLHFSPTACTLPEVDQAFQSLFSVGYD